MTPSQTATPASLLTQAAGERRTGALMVGGDPGGAVYLREGTVVYAESPAAPGVGELLVSAGRLAPRTWQNALDLGTAAACVGRLLVDQGHLTQGELELCALGTIYDAAYFALTAPGTSADFLDGATHWLGVVVHIDAAAVLAEVRRRVRLLDEIHPDPGVDTAAVTPVPRAPRERITLTATQWELMVHADGQRTPADLAQLLGRAGYATIQDLRRLAALGLIERPEVRADSPRFVRLPRAYGTAVDIHRPTAAVVDSPTIAMVAAAVPVVPPRPAVPEPGTADPAGHPLVDPAGAAAAGHRPPRLARRRPGAKLPSELAGEPPPAVPAADEFLLKRIRTALRALR